MRIKVTEEQLTAAFEGALSNGEWTRYYPPFAHVLREVDCHQGRPDFVASPTTVIDIPRDYRAQLASALATPSLARTLSLLKRSAPRTNDYLRRASGLSVPVLRRSISTLGSLGFVARSGQSGYVLAPAFPDTKWELWAFELKVDHWQRALFQALQYRAFAHYVAVVISERWAHRVERQIDRFRTLNVGIIALDSDSGAIRSVLRPRKRSPASRFHHLYALGKFLAHLADLETTRALPHTRAGPPSARASAKPA